jgi:hypothetical protein
MSVIRFEQANALTNFGTGSFDLNFGAPVEKRKETERLTARRYTEKEVQVLLHLVQENTPLKDIVEKLNDLFDTDNKMSRNPRGIKSKIAGDIIYGMFYGYQMGGKTYNYKKVFFNTFTDALGIDKDAAEEYVESFIFSMWGEDVDVQHAKRTGKGLRIIMFKDYEEVDKRSESKPTPDEFVKLRRFKVIATGRDAWNQSTNPFFTEEAFNDMKDEIGNHENLDTFILNSPDLEYARYTDWVKKTVYVFKSLVMKAIAYKLSKKWTKDNINPYVITRVLKKHFKHSDKRLSYPGEIEFVLIKKCIDEYSFPATVGAGNDRRASIPANAGTPYTEAQVEDIVEGMKAKQDIEAIAERPGVARTVNGLRSKILGDFISYIINNKDSTAYKGIIRFLRQFDIYGDYATALIDNTMPALWESDDRGDASLHDRISIFNVNLE